MSYGIDYGRGETNIDPRNGIRYGVINQSAVLQSWADSSEGDYGAPTCPRCGEEAQEAQEATDITPDETWEVSGGGNFVCASCKYAFDGEEAYGETPLGFYLDDGEYKAQCGDDGDIFITLSPYYTHARFCSPCAPGALHLSTPCDDGGPRAYCFAPDWFDVFGEEATGEYDGRKVSCPYPVFRVSDNVCIFRPIGS